MKIKYSLIVSRSVVISLIVSAFVFVFTILIMPLYSRGDAQVYKKVYDALPEMNLSEGFLFYARNLTSREYVHFILSWVASRFIVRDLFIAFFNALLAYVSIQLFQKWKISRFIAALLVSTNFYFLVLYFAAERLKFGFIFLALSFLYCEKIKRFFGFATLALFSHVQVIIIYVSILFNFLVKKILRLSGTGKISKKVIAYFPFILVPILLVGGQIASKFQSYYGRGGIGATYKILLFLFLALCYSKKKRETLLIFIPLVIAAFLVGGNRVNMLGYFVFLYYGAQFKRGWNIGVVTTSIYFAYSSIIFLVNVIQHGNGFFSG